MLNPVQIEEAYKSFINNLPESIHDGILSIDLHFLHETGLLKHLQDSQDDADDLTQYFHVIETPEKVTLFNEQFIVWILPKMNGEQPITLVLIALNHADKPHLEIVFATSGVYNTPKFILKVLEHFLTEVIDTEAIISSMNRPKAS